MVCCCSHRLHAPDFATPASCDSPSSHTAGTTAVLEPLDAAGASQGLLGMGGAYSRMGIGQGGDAPSATCQLGPGALALAAGSASGSAAGGGSAVACTVDPTTRIIRVADKRLALTCTLGCRHAYHLPCWKVRAPIMA